MAWVDRHALEKVAKANAMTFRLEGNISMARTVVGSMFVDDLDESVTPHLKEDGIWEPWITLWMRRIMQPGWVCVDGGANLGYYTLLMAQKAKHVYAYEPIKRYCTLIERNVKMNKHGNVTVFNAALSDGPGWVEFFEHPTNIGSSGTKKFSEASGQFIQAQSLDQLTAKIGQIDFIKLDIEGSEEQAWLGMERTLATSPQTLVAMEFDISRYDQPGKFVNDIYSKCHVGMIDFDGEEKPLTKLQVLNAQDWQMLVLRSKNGT